MDASKFSISMTTLLTGFAVVFAVLLLLIGIIKLYGTVIYNLQNKKRVKKASRNADLPKVEREVADDEPVLSVMDEPEENDDELIAVISAAVYSVYSSSSVRIKSIRKAPARSNAWRSAGISDNVRPF